jgi:hypothetical protein
MTLHARLPASQVTVKRQPISTRTLKSPTLRSSGVRRDEEGKLSRDKLNLLSLSWQAFEMLVEILNKMKWRRKKFIKSEK